MMIEQDVANRSATQGCDTPQSINAKPIHLPAVSGDSGCHRLDDDGDYIENLNNVFRANHLQRNPILSLLAAPGQYMAGADF